MVMLCFMLILFALDEKNLPRSGVGRGGNARLRSGSALRAPHSTSHSLMPPRPYFAAARLFCHCTLTVYILLQIGIVEMGMGKYTKLQPKFGAKKSFFWGKRIRIWGKRIRFE